MAFKLIWSPTAKFDLKDIADFIAEDNASAAAGFVKVDMGVTHLCKLIFRSFTCLLIIDL